MRRKLQRAAGLLLHLGVLPCLSPKIPKYFSQLCTALSPGSTFREPLSLGAKGVCSMPSWTPLLRPRLGCALRHGDTSALQMLARLASLSGSHFSNHSHKLNTQILHHEDNMQVWDFILVFRAGGGLKPRAVSGVPHMWLQVGIAADADKDHVVLNPIFARNGNEGCNRHLEDSPEECSEARELGPLSASTCAMLRQVRQRAKSEGTFQVKLLC